MAQKNGGRNVLASLAGGAMGRGAWWVALVACAVLGAAGLLDVVPGWVTVAATLVYVGLIVSRFVAVDA